MSLFSRKPKIYTSSCVVCKTSFTFSTKELYKQWLKAPICDSCWALGWSPEDERID